MTAPFDPQRRAADPRLSAFVTANAGSGKTSTLVNRVARLLLERVSPEAILCVTYTKAAAAEMQRRLFDRLGEWAILPDAPDGDRPGLRDQLARLEGRDAGSYGPEELSRARALFARALETPGGLKIQTLHAFCEKLLRRFPLEAGVAPNFKVMDDAAAAEIAASAREAVARRADAGDSLVSEIYASFAVTLTHDELERMFAEFESRREAIADYVDSVDGLAGLPQAVAAAVGLDRLRDPEAIEREALHPPALDLEAWRWAAAALSRAKAAGDLDRAARMQSFAERAAGNFAEPADARAIFFTKAGEPAAWCAKSAAARAEPGLCEWLAEEQARISAAFERARAARVAQDTVSALTLARVYAAEYAAAKAARGALDFADLVQLTHDLLTEKADAAWVLFKLDGGVEHVLVDEAQDTAPEQWAILQALTEEFFAGDDGRVRPLERTVFVVGDEKQSIFSFQGAAPEQLGRARERYQLMVEGAGQVFEPVPLLTSWRSTPHVLNFVDAVFDTEEGRRALTPGQGEGALVRHLAGRSEHEGAIDLWPLEREEEAEERRAWDEPLDSMSNASAWLRLAERIAAEIKAIVERGELVHDKDTRQWRPATYGDVLILVRKRKVLFEELLRALRRAGVPVAGADRLNLSQHPVFEDCLALARFALFPQDDLTLAALLRSPFCDVGEESLFHLAHGRQAPSLWATLGRREGERPEWAAAYDLLGWAVDSARTLGPFDFFGQALSRLDPKGRSMRARILRRLGSEAQDALDEFLAQALAAEGRGVHDLERFADALARLNVTVKREMDEPKGEVRVMTAHGSKGLEAPIVFLPETVGAGAARGSPLLETEEGGFLWCGSSAADCQASAAARELRNRRAEEEALRLLYVALTRARDRLIVAGRVNARQKDEGVKGWWRMLDAAFAHPEVAARETTVGERTIRRFGADPKTGSATAGGAAEAPASIPAWATGLAGGEGVGRTAAPSRLSSARDAAPSPLAAERGLGRFRRGVVIHKLFELLPDVRPDRRAETAARLLSREPDLDEGQRAEMASAVLGVLEDSRFAEVFGPGSRAEVAIAGEAAGLPAHLARVSGRLDRLVVTPGRVLVVDYKTNRPAPERAEDVDPAYLEQMAVYVAVLRTVYPDRPVHAALVWTDGPRLTALPDSLIAATLDRLRGL